MNDWNIQSRSHVCQGCEKSFADKEHYHTLLFQDRHELRRLDICKECWASKYSQGDSAIQNVISHWKGVYEVPPPAPPEAIQKETAETLLRKLIEQNDPKHGAACFILAVMLERKRLLKVKEQFKHEGKRVFVYEQPKTGDLFTITDPDLQLNQLDEVQKDVSYLLEHGLSTGTPPEAGTPTEATPAETAPSEAAPAESSSDQAAASEEPAPEVASSGEPAPKSE